MGKSILVTTDFSVSSKSAIVLALRLCKEMKVDLILLHSYRLTNKNAEDVIAWKRNIEADSKEKFSLIESELLKSSGITYTARIEVGFVADRVEETIRNSEVLFLVTDRLMYSRSKATFDELVEGTDVPIIIAPFTQTSVADPLTSPLRSPDA